MQHLDKLELITLNGLRYERSFFDLASNIHQNLNVWLRLFILASIHIIPQFNVT